MFCFHAMFLLMFTSPCSCCEYVIPAGHVVRPAKRGSMHPDLSEREAPCVGGSEREHPGARAPVHGRALQDRGPRCRGIHKVQSFHTWSKFLSTTISGMMNKI